MVPGWGLLLVSLAYIGGLFAVAWFGDRNTTYPSKAALRPIVYSLALAVYCSSWTFYGAVGSAARDGASYLPIYIGPILLFVFGMPFFERLVRIAKRHNVTSIADLIASRFGKSSRIAAAITLVALTSAVPYVALQLKAVAMSIEVLTGSSGGLSHGWFSDSAFYVAIMLALFAILFGTRGIDAAEHHPGLMLAIAVESLVKLLAFIAIGVFALMSLGGPMEYMSAARSLPVQNELFTGFVTQMLLAFTAIFCLPRQFQVGVVECTDAGDLSKARWMFPGYLVLISVLVVPIAALGLATAGPDVASDSFVLWLPLQAGHESLALVAYVGGFSAATGMVIVACVALATMVSNDLLLPLVWRYRAETTTGRRATTRLVLWVRRAAIVGVLLLAYIYYRAVPSAPSLASIGLLSFAAVAQFAPTLVAAMYWQRASRAGILAGLIVGYFLWMYTLLLPSLLAIDGVVPAWVEHGPFGWSFLAPQALFGWTAPDVLSHGVFWSLIGNVLALVVFSLRYRPSLGAQLQAAAFLAPAEAGRGSRDAPLPGNTTVGDLMTLAEHIVGPRASAQLLAHYARDTGKEMAVDSRADFGLVQAVERELAGAIGSASARMMLTSTLRGAGLKLDQVVALLDETTEKLRLNRGLLEAMMDNMAQAISMVDRDLRLVAWNQRYETLFDYPPGFLYVGMPINEAIQLNAERGLCGAGDPVRLTRRRMAHLRSGSPHVSERLRPDGRVVETRVQPMADGGMVSTFTDVTDYKKVESELREIAETLEMRVEERTEQLRQAKLEAEQANHSKTKFVAAASHDLLQPMNAARLFVSALRSRDLKDGEAASLAERVDTSLRAAEELVDALLDISKLDAGAVQPEIKDVAAADLLESLAEQFAPLAADRGLELTVMPTRLAVRTDPRMLKRVLQNFIANALRYTRHGGVLVGCRRRGTDVEFQVWDTGPGVPSDALALIFEEFRRLEQPSPWGEKGVGLGLSICDRIARILDHKLVVSSRHGHGSVFAIRTPRSVAPAVHRSVHDPRTRGVPLQGMTVLCLDDELDILDGMAALLGRWDVRVLAARTIAEAEVLAVAERPDVILADFHLRESESGLDALSRLSAMNGGRPGALVTANASVEVVAAARAGGFEMLRKPVKPAALRALLAAFARRKVAGAGSSVAAAQAVDASA
jgi:Na+/proline symporter/signal transduction histidine kinase/ActR/RegA family two-component response regulator